MFVVRGVQVTALGGQMTVEDFINVHIGIGILPADPVLHVGTKVCFTSHLTGENGMFDFPIMFMTLYNHALLDCQIAAFLLC